MSKTLIFGKKDFKFDQSDRYKCRKGKSFTFGPTSLLKVPYLQAFGRAAHNLLPDLVHAWVTGGQSSKKSPSARLNDDELEPRIIAGKILSCT